MILGIDLGTTFSVAAFMGKEGPQLVRNAVGEVLTPSVVGVDEDGRLLVGSAARELLVVQPGRCASVFKRCMGTDYRARLANQEFTPEELSSAVLRSIKEDAEAALAMPITDAVITVPAYFNDNQRKATIHAGQIAGLNVRRIINEPTAAAMAYGFHEAKEDRMLLVFDLGGGTFDVSIVEVFDGALEVRASSGDGFLGGEDFTRALASRLLLERGVAFEHAEINAPHQVSRLLQQCELAKRRLTEQPTAKVRIPNKEGQFTEGDAAVEVRREQFQAWTEQILARVELPIRRALGDAGLRRNQIDDVILVGGATRMTAVREFVERWFAKSPRSALNPDEVVALGAAVQAGLIAGDSSVSDLVMTDVAPFTLGVQISRRIGVGVRDGYFLPIINRNTTIPVSRVERVSTLSSNQVTVSVHVYQGEARRVEDNLKLGEFEVYGIPLGPPGQEVDIRFTYDLNGILEVEATIVKTGAKIQHLITKHAQGMTNETIQQAVRQMQALKTHPREEAVNRLLLRRAERLYAELSLPERQQLSDLLDGFESAMETSDKQAIAEFQQVLQGLLDRLESGFNDQGGGDSSNEQW